MDGDLVAGRHRRYDAISTIADAGRQVENGAHTIADNLSSAGRGAQHTPVVGDTVGKPLDTVGQAAVDGALHELETTASWLVVLLALAVVAALILVAAVPWLYLRLRFSGAS